MPSIAWFPLAILLFGLSERAILFVVVLGAAPSIANGLIAGVDNVPPAAAARPAGARRAGSVDCTATSIAAGRAARFVGGLKQGWAFAWRSLMAGELLVIIAGQPSIGVLLQTPGSSRRRGLLAAMIVILVVGIVVDSVFGGPTGRPPPLGPDRRAETG